MIREDKILKNTLLPKSEMIPDILQNKNKEEEEEKDGYVLFF